MPIHDLTNQRAETVRPLTTRQGLAKQIGTSVRTIDEWKALGIIPHFKIGGLVRFDFDEVMATLRERYAVQAKTKAAK